MATIQKDTFYTIGHSKHPAEVFISLLKDHGITAVADVRSRPYSRFNPQFNKQRLTDTLHSEEIEYLFLGKELGARSDDPACYRDNRVVYGSLAKTALFKEGIQRLHEGIKQYRVALMCAEKEPLQCHRTMLVGRHLVDQGFDVQHILADSSLQSYENSIDRLIDSFQTKEDMFMSREQLKTQAIDRQSELIAYTRPVK